MSPTSGQSALEAAPTPRPSGCGPAHPAPHPAPQARTGFGRQASLPGQALPRPPRLSAVLGASLSALGLALAPVGARAQPGDEVPFITTPDAVTLAMLRLAGVQASDHVIDLGSGDGRIVITAARRFGASGLGVEIDPQLVQRSRQAARQAGVDQRTEFREQDLFATDLSRATVVTLYLLPEFNLRLRPALQALPPGTRVVSHDWDMGDWLPDRSLTLDVPDKAIGREKISRVHLWVVPARVAGWWCGRPGQALWLEQRHQQVQGLAHARSVPGGTTGPAQRSTPTSAPMPEAAAQTTAAWGQVQGARIGLWAVATGLPAISGIAGSAALTDATGADNAARQHGRVGELQLRWQPNGLVVEQAAGLWAGWAGQALRPATRGGATTPDHHQAQAACGA